jgi:hypothetical protein
MGAEERIATEINSYHVQDDEQQCVFAPFMFWDGWAKSPADTLRKRAVQEIWESRLPFPVTELVGIEYWVRTFKPGQYLAAHVDEDTFLYSGQKIFAGPKIGSVWYGPQQETVVGGQLELYNIFLTDGDKNALEGETMGARIKDATEKELIDYQPNRLVIMDTGHQVHGTVPAKSGIRYVMVTNVWHTSRPPTALELGTFFYEDPE